MPLGLSAIIEAMLSWGTKRRLIITLTIFAIGVLFLVWYSVTTFYHAPTCSDGKKNGDEAGVDCGGVCTRLCLNQGLAPIVHWQRAFLVSRGRYNAVAYVENPNLRSGAKDAPYVFRLYDGKSILVAERSGSTVIPPHQVVAVFEANIYTGDRVPARVEFAFDKDSPPAWTLLPATVPELRISEQNITDTQTTPLLTARISNNSQQRVASFPVVALVYDENGNARAVSQTVADTLGQTSSVSVNFSWPSPFDFVPARIEIIPKIYPGINY